jgi:hypothetical protein
VSSDDTTADKLTDSGSLSRRMLLGGGAALGVGLVAFEGVGAAAAPSTSAAPSSASVRAAVRFLQGVTDAHRGTGFRLAQSYYDDSGLTDIAFVYDNALAIIALLAGGDVARARAIGDALLYAQTHDPDHDDGRLRQAYHANDFVFDNGDAHFGYEYGFVGTAVGDMSWAGIALAQLARRTRQASYLTGARRIAEWIHRETYTTTGLGGYDFGETPGLAGFKSAEHNIDVYAFFNLIARLTGQPVWRRRADHAWAFIERLWNAEDGFFWTGSNDGSTINKSPTQLPLDVQTWSWLAARRARYAEALDWAATNLAVTDTPQRTNSQLTGNQKVSGVAFGSGSLKADTETPIDAYHGGPDTGAVWFEGTAQLALSLRDRGYRGDRADAEELLAAVAWAQRELGDGQTFNGKRIEGGIVAASSPMNTGFGFGYYQHLHVGATSWYVMAGTDSNPYRFL